jgi:signal transduction histidine kinase
VHPSIPTIPDKAALLLRWIPHVMLVAVVVGMLTRVAQVATELCWSVAPPAVLLMITYGAGLALWERMSLRGRHLWLGLLLVLWCWIAWFLPANLAFGYAWLAVPLAILALRMFTDGAAVLVVGLITALLVACLVRATEGFRLDLWAPPAAVVWAAVALYRGQQRLVHELRRTRDELARQQREAGKLAERARIARDLHDSLVQELVGSRMLLQAAERDWDRQPEAAKSQVHTVTEALGASLADTRSIIRDLTPPALKRDDLTAALRELCIRKGAADGAPQVLFQTCGEPRGVHPDEAAVLLRVVQGLLANAYEHARAAQVWITLQYRDDDTITVEVRDDGVGFDVASLGAGPQSASNLGGGRGFGLTAVRDRLAAHGGTCVVESAHGRGTRVLATLPTGISTLTGTW